MYLLGGPGTLMGKFEDAGGLPDRQGWLGVDLTQLENHWQVSTYSAANLDPETVPNHAWWCGALFESCGADDPPEGYGDGWVEWLDWWGSVADPTTGVTVRVTARLNHDTETVEDYLYLQYEAGGWMNNAVSLTGQQTGVDVDVTFTLSPVDYLGDQQDQVHLRWCFQSDGGWSDEDCRWPTGGAAQLDMIAVYFDQGSGEVQLGETETCEPGSDLQWQENPPQGVGDFSQVWPLLDDVDPAHDNGTPQFAFIDDGVVVPGTGGYPCTTWCYGPGGYIVNPVGGLSELMATLQNEIWSPVLAVPALPELGMMLSFDVYVHEELQPNSPGIAHLWHVRSTSDPAGQVGWTEWRDRNVWVHGGPSYLREEHGVSDLLVPDCTFVQLALGVYDIPAWSGTDGTPAPYFDNVALKAFTRTGGAVFTVAPDGSGDYPTIQAAINATADQDTVELADGVYTGPGNRDLTFQGRAITMRSASADPIACIIDCEGSETENHRGINFNSNEGYSAVLAGITIRNGFYSDRSGGAISCRGTSPTIRNCRFENNEVNGINEFGGAICCQNASPIIQDCVFIANTGARGGAIGIDHDAHPIITGCLFLNNTGTDGGGGICAYYNEAEVYVSACTFVANSGYGPGGTIHTRFDATVHVDNSIITGGLAGGAVDCTEGGQVNLACSDIYGNYGGDWTGCIAGQLGSDGNISQDPLFCGDLAPNAPYTLISGSPCAPADNPDCGLIGALPVGCAGPDDVAESEQLPVAPHLYGCYPNPFNPRTTIRFDLSRTSRAALSIFNLAGRRIVTLVDTELEGGRHSSTWDGRDTWGRAVSSGTYFVRLTVDSVQQTRRMLLLR